MPLPIIPNTWRCAFDWTHANGQTAENVMHFRNSVDFEDDVRDDIFSAWNRDMIHPVDNQAELRSITLTQLDGISASTTYETDYATNPKWSGNELGDMVPALSMVVTLYTATRGRRARGRTYLPFCGETAQTDGSFAVTEVALVQAGFTAFVAALALTNTRLVVASYVEDAARDVVTVLARQVAATQRRRQSRLRT